VSPADAAIDPRKPFVLSGSCMIIVERFECDNPTLARPRRLSII
jgi:hypothetical protein